MSLFYKCDCCGQLMHKLGEDGEKRLHLDVGDLTDPVFNSANKVPEWNVTDRPLIRLDLCQNCYDELIGRIRDLRVARGLVPDLTGVSVDGKSV